jgi:hypothetical protein
VLASGWGLGLGLRGVQLLAFGHVAGESDGRGFVFGDLGMEVLVLLVGEVLHEGLAAGDGEDHEDNWTNDKYFYFLLTLVSFIKLGDELPTK